MQITIWSDFVCPFCFIGATHLDKALESFPHADDVKIEYKSFQLEPGAKYVGSIIYGVDECIYIHWHHFFVLNEKRSVNPYN